MKAARWWWWRTRCACWRTGRKRNERTIIQSNYHRRTDPEHRFEHDYTGRDDAESAPDGPGLPARSQSTDTSAECIREKATSGHGDTLLGVRAGLAGLLQRTACGTERRERFRTAVRQYLSGV